MRIHLTEYIYVVPEYWGFTLVRKKGNALFFSPRLSALSTTRVRDTSVNYPSGSTCRVKKLAVVIYTAARAFPVCFYALKGSLGNK